MGVSDAIVLYEVRSFNLCSGPSLLAVVQQWGPAVTI